MKVTFYRQKGSILTRRKGGWRWHLQASNGPIIAESGQAYANLEDAQHGFDLTINAGVHGYTEVYPAGEDQSR